MPVMNLQLQTGCFVPHFDGGVLTIGCSNKDARRMLGIKLMRAVVINSNLLGRNSKSPLKTLGEVNHMFPPLDRCDNDAWEVGYDKLKVLISLTKLNVEITEKDECHSLDFKVEMPGDNCKVLAVIADALYHHYPDLLQEYGFNPKKGK